MRKSANVTIGLTTSVIVLMSSFVAQSAQTNVGKRNCTTTIMCCIPGKGCFSPNTPTGYTCNNGHAESVTRCIPTSLPPKDLKPIR